jgi:hypothetical protein
MPLAAPTHALLAGGHQFTSSGTSHRVVQTLPRRIAGSHEHRHVAQFGVGANTEGL